MVQLRLWGQLGQERYSPHLWDQLGQPGRVRYSLRQRGRLGRLGLSGQEPYCPRQRGQRGQERCLPRQLGQRGLYFPVSLGGRLGRWHLDFHQRRLCHLRHHSPVPLGGRFLHQRRLCHRFPARRPLLVRLAVPVGLEVQLGQDARRSGQS